MARFLLVTLLLVCLFCMYQAAPSPQEQASTADIEKTMQETWNNVKAKAEETYNSIANNKGLQDIIASGKEALQKAADAVRQEVNKVIPPTE